ncbi:hypothetical protein GGR50DRAFT_678812 [Xylaria sp. CBS 124048]|nr:hypothetical protein GGR50DRAFT_678812 [Xylaria sp. CBS 124048]
MPNIPLPLFWTLWISERLADFTSLWIPWRWKPCSQACFHYVSIVSLAHCFSLRAKDGGTSRARERASFFFYHASYFDLDRRRNQVAADT